MAARNNLGRVTPEREDDQADDTDDAHDHHPCGFLRLKGPSQRGRPIRNRSRRALFVAPSFELPAIKRDEPRLQGPLTGPRLAWAVTTQSAAQYPTGRRQHPFGADGNRLRLAELRARSNGTRAVETPWIFFHNRPRCAPSTSARTHKTAALGADSFNRYSAARHADRPGTGASQAAAAAATKRPVQLPRTSSPLGARFDAILLLP